MSYTPTQWKAGDTVTSAKLNKMEQGIAAGGGILVVHDEDGTLDKTWQEILDSDKVCIILDKTQDFKMQAFITYVSEFDGDYQVFITSDVINADTHRYVAYSPDEYPHKDF